MKRTKHRLLPLILVAVFSACSGWNKATPTAPSPTSPSAPVAPSPPNGGPGSGTIAIRELSPAAGATLVVRSDCPAGRSTRICVENWRGTFEVLVDREMTNAVLTVSFYDGQTKCGYGAGTLDSVPAGERVSFSMHGVVVKDESLAQPCRLPATTNRIEALLWSDHGNWTNTLTQEFEGGYTFSAPVTTPNPPSAGEISIGEVVPPSGATLVMRDCGNSSNLCTDQLRTTFDVVMPFNVEDAVVIVSLRRASTVCVEWAQRTVLSANTRTSFSTSRFAMSVGEDLQMLCPLPLETTRLTFAVFRTLSPSGPLVSRELPYRYTLTSE